MDIKLRQYEGGLDFGEDYENIRQFIIRINLEDQIYPNFIWGRWEWMVSLNSYSIEDMRRIYIWEDGDKIVGILLFEDCLDEYFLMVDSAYPDLKKIMLDHADTLIERTGKIRIMIPDSDRELQRYARKIGYRPIQDKQVTAVIDIDDSITYDLNPRFKVVSLADDFDIAKYSQVLHRGFNHGKEVPKTQANYDRRKKSLSGPNNNMDIKIAIAAPNGEFVAYCGMWYDDATQHALVEPVATDPSYRKMGLGKAAVLEGVIRCGRLGAKRAYVGSSQQFYYNIGFDPIYTETWWEKR